MNDVEKAAGFSAEDLDRLIGIVGERDLTRAVQRSLCFQLKMALAENNSLLDEMHELIPSLSQQSDEWRRMTEQSQRDAEVIKHLNEVINEMADTHAYLYKKLDLAVDAIEYLHIRLAFNAEGKASYGGFHTVPEEFAGIDRIAVETLAKLKEMEG